MKRFCIALLTVVFLLGNSLSLLAADNTKAKDYRFFLYNKNTMTKADITAMNGYLKKFTDGISNVSVDVSKCKSAAEIYIMLKARTSVGQGKLVGIQIFGTSKDVPAFEVNQEVAGLNNKITKYPFKTDFFYSSFNSDANVLKESYSVTELCDENKKVSFLAEWPVARLPLKSGEYTKYFAKVEQYAKQASNKPFGEVVNFSSPGFATETHRDDFGYFLRERVDKEFHILSSADYQLYGNKQGKYPIKTEVLGDYSIANLKKENKSGIKEFVINTRGNQNALEQVIYTSTDTGSEKRIPFLTSANINIVLAQHFYDLDLWSGANARDLNDSSIVYQAMAKGKCVSAIGTSSSLHVAGADNQASLQAMKNSNLYYFYLTYFYNRALGETRSKSFSIGQYAYAQESLKHKDIEASANYIHSLTNVLSQHYLGVLEYWKTTPKPEVKTNIQLASSGNKIPFDGKVDLDINKAADSFTINSVLIQQAGVDFQLVVDLDSKLEGQFNIGIMGKENKLIKQFENQVKAGNNTLEMTIRKEEIFNQMFTELIKMSFGYEKPEAFAEFKIEKLLPFWLSGM